MTNQPSSALKCVPFNPEWVTSEKLDLKAIYKRPVRDAWGKQKHDADGVPQWDVTGPLPIRRHQDWVNSGFVYLTLADFESLTNPHVLSFLRSRGLQAREYQQDPLTLGPWHLETYLQGQREEDTRELAALRALVEQLGAEAVTAVRRHTDPTFTLPPALQNMKAKAAKA